MTNERGWAMAEEAANIYGDEVLEFLQVAMPLAQDDENEHLVRKLVADLDYNVLLTIIGFASRARNEIEHRRVQRN